MCLGPKLYTKLYPCTDNIAVAIGTDKLLAFLYGVLILVPGISEFVLMILYKE